MGFVVRHIGPPDWRLVRAARLRALEDAPYAFGSTFAEEIERDDSFWRSTVDRLAWFVALDGSEPAGVVAVLSAQRDRPDRLEIISTWVAAHHRRTGVGNALMAAAREWATEAGATTLTLSVTEGNEPARRFYERLGFSSTGSRRPLRSNPNVSALEMRLPLTAVRLRFAPSPIGDLHVGHVRIGVLTWILARQHNGSYFVRFENTDRTKEVAGSRDAILGDLTWLGLLGPEQPRDQADMTDSYLEALEHLGAGGHTYRDGAAIRFRTPTGGTVEWDDLARGRVALRNDDLDDPVLVRSSGTPTFYLASSIDDIEDRITHLVRSEPFRRITAKQIHIWGALAADSPQAGHVPLVTRPHRGPVRVGGTGDVTVRAMRERGISPTSLLMYLALPQVASWKEPPADLDLIVERLDLRRVSRRPITFDLRALEVLDRRCSDSRSS